MTAFLNSDQDPSESQNRAQIEAFLRAVAVGECVASRSTQGGLLGFDLLDVTAGDDRCIYTNFSAGWGRNKWYRKSGKNTFAPTGQSILVIPTPEVISFVEADWINSRDHRGRSPSLQSSSVE